MDQKDIDRLLRWKERISIELFISNNCHLPCYTKEVHERLKVFEKETSKMNARVDNTLKQLHNK